MSATKTSTYSFTPFSLLTPTQSLRWDTIQCRIREFAANERNFLWLVSGLQVLLVAGIFASRVFTNVDIGTCPAVKDTRNSFFFLSTVEYWFSSSLAYMCQLGQTISVSGGV